MSDKSKNRAEVMRNAGYSEEEIAAHVIIMKEQDRVKHLFNHANYGYGRVMWVIGDNATVKWDTGGTSMEPLSNLELVEE